MSANAFQTGRYLICKYVPTIVQPMMKNHTNVIRNIRCLIMRMTSPTDIAGPAGAAMRIGGPAGWGSLS